MVLSKRPGGFEIFNYALLTLLSFVTIYPFLYVLSMSVSDPTAVLTNKVWLFPVGFSLKAYQMVFKSGDLWRSYYNSAWYAAVGTVANIFMTMLGAYALSRRRYVFRSAILVLLTITMFFGGGLIPSFLLVKWLGLYNTRWALIVPALTSAWNIIIARIYINESIPESLIEAAQIDGYSDVEILFRIVYPLSLPIIAYLALNCIVGYWNSYFAALIYLPNKALQPIQIFLMRILINASPEIAQSAGSAEYFELYKYGMQIKYGAIIVAIAPILCIYPFMQKYFIKGIMIGSIK